MNHALIQMDIPAVLQGAKALHLGPQLLQDVATGRVEIVCLTRVPGHFNICGFEVPITVSKSTSEI